MPDADDNEGHESDCAIFAVYVNKDLQNWLSDFAGNRSVEILDGEKKTQDEEPAEDSRDSDRHENAQRSRPRRLLCFLREMGRCVEACYRILGHQNTAAGHISIGSSHSPTDSIQAGPVIELPKDKMRTLMFRSFCNDSHCERKYPERMEDDGSIVEISENVDTEGIDYAVRK